MSANRKFHVPILSCGCYPSQHKDCPCLCKDCNGKGFTSPEDKGGLYYDASPTGDFHAPSGNIPISQNWQHNEIEALKERVAALERRLEDMRDA